MTPPLQAILENAGMVQLENGLTGDPLMTVADAFVPHRVRLISSGRELEWPWPKPVGLFSALIEGRAEPNHRGNLRFPRKTSSAGMLDAFVKMKDAHDVLGFSRRYGVLGVCKHRLPASDRRLYLHEGAPCSPARAPGDPVDLHTEPISAWLDFVHGAEATLRLAVAIRDGGTGQVDDWREAWGCLRPAADNGWLFDILVENSAANARASVCGLVNTWLEAGGTGHKIEWRSAEPQLVFTGPSGPPPTVAVLANQLMLAVTKVNQVAMCSGCGHPYFRTGRRPQRGRRNYCGLCGGPESPVPARDRQRALRAQRQKPPKQGA